MDAPRADRPQSVLFACGLNSVRSPMARRCAASVRQQLYIGSAGVNKGEPTRSSSRCWTRSASIRQAQPQTFEELEDWEGLNFDLIVTLSPEAHHRRSS